LGGGGSLLRRSALLVGHDTSIVMCTLKRMPTVGEAGGPSDALAWSRSPRIACKSSPSNSHTRLRAMTHPSVSDQDLRYPIGRSDMTTPLSAGGRAPRHDDLAAA